jgi:very-short-patch-repair endonuclease
MTKAETRIPFQYCVTCANRKTNGGFGRPSSAGKFYQVNGIHHWKCNECRALEIATMTTNHRSGAELQLAEVLRATHIHFQSKFKFKSTGFEYDFAFPRRKLIIEIDSPKAHKGQNRRKRDAGKDALATKKGWAVVRLAPWPPSYFVKTAINAILSHREKRDGSYADEREGHASNRPPSRRRSQGVLSKASD